MSRFVDIGVEERRTKTEAIRSGICGFKHNQGVFIQHHDIVRPTFYLYFVLAQQGFQLSY